MNEATRTAASLVEWLRAQLDEDEQAARAAWPGPWRYNPRKQWESPKTFGRPQAPPEEYVAAGPLTSPECVAVTGPADDEKAMSTAEHIVRHDPARVLAEVAAKRRIIDEVMGWDHDDPDGAGYYSCPLVPDSTRAADDEWDGVSCLCGLAARRMAILRPLASSYADRPGYRQEWV